MAVSGGETAWLEKRSSLRFPCFSLVYNAKTKKNIGRLLDISQGGMRIETKRNQAIESGFDFSFATPLQNLRLSGEVAWHSREESQFGIKFFPLTGDKRQVLEHFLTQRHKVDVRSTLFSHPEFRLTWPTQNCSAENPTLAQWLGSLDLGDELVGLSDRYSQCGYRTPFIWQWGYGAAWLTTLDGVQDPDHVCRTKVATIMLNGLVDDLADKFHNAELCDKAHGMLLRGRNFEEVAKDLEDDRWRSYFRLISDIWFSIEARLKTYLNYESLKPVLRFDFEQLFNAMRYACLANTVRSFSNLTEYFLYQPPNMNVMLHGTIDLMNHPAFDINELGKVRTILWKAQKLARIANALSTWRRELHEKDLSNPILAYAFEQGLVTMDDFDQEDMENIEEKISRAGYHLKFQSMWLLYYEDLLSSLKKNALRSLDLSGFVASMPRLLTDFHLDLEGNI